MHAIRRKLRRNATIQFNYQPSNPNAVLFRLPRHLRRPIFSNYKIGGIRFIRIFRVNIQISISR